MKKSKMEDEVKSMEIDDSLNELPLLEVVKPEHKTRKTIVRNMSQGEDNVSCLRNERIVVKYILRQKGIVTNPKHVLFGGMAENATRTFVVPKLSSGMFVNILTDSEKSFLEEIMGLEYNALSIYKKLDNFWDDSNENGISKVTLHKLDNYFDLSDPEDYIRYKILLANKDFIAPSWEVLQSAPKATYQFVITSEAEENKSARDNMSATMKCYKEYGKVEDDINTLRVIIETLDGRPTSATAKLEFLLTKINDLIQADSRLFLKVISDPMLSTKVLIKRSIEAGFIANRGNYLYLRDTDTPLCEANEEPTLNIAAKYLNTPKHLDIKFSLEAKLKK